MKPRSAVALRHIAFEDLDALEAPLRDAGFEVTYVDTATARELDFTDSALAADLLVVLGGPMGVYETASYPFLATEIDLVRRRLGSKQAVLGICLGAQIIAAALDARVYPGQAGKEIGWGSLSLTEAGHASVLKGIGESHKVLHWHGDTFDLPDGATLLASTPRYPNQAFSYGDSGLALQFHLEASATGLERWYQGHAAELATEAIEVAALREESRQYGPAANRVAVDLMRSFLARIES
jgi:GMP synthase (glutamine-hydrolysing)